MKLKEIAAAINSHLQRLEKDMGWNESRKFDSAKQTWVSCAPREGERQLWNSYATAVGRYVFITYVSYQGRSHLTKADAETYLAWLDAGNKGKHFRVIGFNVVKTANG